MRSRTLLNEIQIRSISTKTTYDLGCQDYLMGRVEHIQAGMQRANPAYIAVVVTELGNTYTPRVVLSKWGGSVDGYACNCPDSERKLQACRHVVALLKAIQVIQSDGKNGQKPKADHKYISGDNFLRLLAGKDKAQPTISAATQEVSFVPNLLLDRYATRTVIRLEFRLGTDRLYVVKNLSSLMSSYMNKETVEFGKQLTLNTANFSFKDEISEKLWQMVWRVYRHEENNSRSGWMISGTRSFNQKQFTLSEPLKNEFFQIMEGQELDCSDLTDYSRRTGRVRVTSGKPQLNFALKEETGGAKLDFKAEPIYSLADDNHLLLQGSTVYICEPELAREIEPYLSTFMGDERAINLRSDRLPLFFGEYLPTLSRMGEVEVEDTFQKKYLLEELLAEFYVSYQDDELEVTPQFRYGEVKFNPLKEHSPTVPDRRVLVRSVARERNILSLFGEYGFKQTNVSYRLSDEEKCYDFLSEGLERLHAMAEVYYSDDFANRPVRSMPKITAGVSVNNDNLLEITFSAKDIDFAEILAVLKDYRQKKRFHRMADGSFISLSEQELSPLSDMMENLNIKKVKTGDEALKVPLSQAMYLDELARDSDNLRLDRSRSFKHMIKSIRTPDDEETDPPQELANTLREYQVTGFRWLNSLAKYHLGGILADDMGLGKTLQVLAFLLAKQETAQAPSLVIAPTSLLYNWLEETERFTPNLSGQAVTGTRTERENILSAETPPDFFVTTYNLLRRDIDLYEERSFNYCFLDEAQHIKNPDTKAAKAVKSLKAQGYFALTGTPFENTLTELWSIFDFLLPGYLLNHAKFKQRYESPIVKEEDGKALNDLRRHITPFVLRRLKKEVLKELPDKVESRRLAPMTEEQAKIYKAYFVRSQKEFADALAEAGIAQSKIKILALLTRLRQIACDPALFLEDYHGGSGKLDMLEEVAVDAVQGGHRMLVFSQFTTMLRTIQERLTSQGLECLYLDGQTPSKERMNLVKSFNTGTVPIFLISLKAGGTGLNLTGADMVIHFDPWWNPAVEDQATDRAYRIGQQKNVQVLKFIAKDTIEERIYKLQEKKRNLFDQMIKPGESFLSGLTDEEIKSLFAV